MASPFTAEELGRLIDALLKPSALIELGVLAGCLLLAWAIVRLARGPVPRKGSMLSLIHI